VNVSQALGLAQQLQVLLEVLCRGAPGPVDLVLLLWLDVEAIERRLLRAAVPGMDLHGCSGLRPTTSCCELDLFTSETFCGSESVLYLNTSHLLLDGRALLALLF